MEEGVWIIMGWISAVGNMDDLALWSREDQSCCSSSHLYASSFLLQNSASNAPLSWVTMMVFIPQVISGLCPWLSPPKLTGYSSCPSVSTNSHSLSKTQVSVPSCIISQISCSIFVWRILKRNQKKISEWNRLKIKPSNQAIMEWKHFFVPDCKLCLWLL